MNMLIEDPETQCLELGPEGAACALSGFCWERYAAARLSQFEYADQREEEECVEDMKCMQSDMEFEADFFAKT